MDSQYWVVAMTVNHGISNKKNGQQDLFPDTPGALPHVDEGPDG